MKRHICSAAAVLLLAGCSSSPKPFGPAYSSDFGYRNTQIQNDRFRISYTSRNAYEARDFALLRAAQITEIEGYSHFKIVSGDYYDNGPNIIGSHIGIGLGGGRHNGSHVDIGVRDVTRALEGQKATETIEIVLLSAAPANDLNVFSAESVIKHIVPYGAAPKPWPSKTQTP